MSWPSQDDYTPTLFSHSLHTPCITPNYVVELTKLLGGLREGQTDTIRVAVDGAVLETIVYRLVDKGAVRRTKKIGNAHIFEPVITRKSAYRRLLDDVLGLFGGSAAAVMAHLVDSGKLSLADLREAEQMLARKRKKP